MLYLEQKAEKARHKSLATETRSSLADCCRLQPLEDQNHGRSFVMHQCL